MDEKIKMIKTKIGMINLNANNLNKHANRQTVGKQKKITQ